MPCLAHTDKQGVNPERPRLFVIDGSKALRCAIDCVFDSRNPVQRCRNQKIRNVLGYLPDDQKEQTMCEMKAAFLIQADKGKKKMHQLAKWLEKEYPSASSSLFEDIDDKSKVV